MKTKIQSLAVALGLVSLAGLSVAEPTVYIPLGSANQVIAVDAATDTIERTFSGVTNAHGLVATPDGEYLVAGSLQEKAGTPKDALNSQLFLIHPAHGHVMATIPVSGWSHHQAMTPDGRYVLSTHPVRGTLSVVDMTSNELVRTIETGPAPNYTLVADDNRTAYVSNSGNGTIAEVDLEKGEVKRRLEAGPAPEHLVFSADKRRIYATNPRAGTVSEVDIATGKVARTFPVGRSVHGLDMGDDGKTLFASSKKDNKLVAIDTETGNTRSIDLAPAPYHLNTIRGTGKVYVSSRKRPVIWVIDQASLKVLGSIDLPGGEGHQMAIVD